MTNWIILKSRISGHQKTSIAVQKQHAEIDEDILLWNKYSILIGLLDDKFLIFIKYFIILETMY